MSLIVMKFGGTSIANVDRIKAVAQRIKDEADQGHQVIVVVSAMAGVTNQLVGWAHQSSEKGLLATEYDVVVSSGEQVTAGLMALALNELGLPARSFLGWQVGFETTAQHKQAQIRTFHEAGLRSSLSNGDIAVVAGFQGVTDQQRLSTLGRGGSDYTAVTLAAAMNADRCDIYTDVNGIYTADPHVITDAKLIPKISYKDVLSFAKNGAKVIQAQAIEQGYEKGLTLRVLSSFNHQPGTQITADKASTDFIGVASRKDLSFFKLAEGRSAQSVLDLLRQNAVECDTGWHSDTTTPCSVVVPSQDFQVAKDILQQNVPESLRIYPQVAKVALVGPVESIDVIFTALEEREIDVIASQVSDEGVRLILARPDMEAAVKYLHTTYLLKQKSAKDVA